MKKQLAIPLAALAFATLGGSLYHTAFARTSNAERPTTLAQGYGMGAGMMGGMMMGTPNGDQQQPAQTAVNPQRARALVGYIHQQGLSCMQCHAVAGSSYGPSFGGVAAHYQGNRDGEGILAGHISEGFGPMPPGLANKAQAAHLATLILDLDQASN